MEERLLCALLVVVGYLTVVEGQQCQRGWERGPEGTCYRFSDEPMSKQDASKSCTDDGGRLLQIRDQAVQNFVVKRLKDLGLAYAWLGLSEKPLERFVWPDGTDLLNQGCYSRQSLRNGQSSNFETSSLRGERVTASDCIQNCRTTVDRNGRSYNYASVELYNGNVECRCAVTFRPTPGDLVTGCNQKCAGDQSQRCGSPNDDDKMIVFSLSAGDSLTSPHRRDNPNNYNEYQKCMAMDRSFNDFTFGDEQCSNEYGYICDNPDGIDFGGKRMSFHTDPKNWYEARYDCISRKGDIVKLTTADEWAAAREHIIDTDPRISYWTGAHLSKFEWDGEENESARLGFSQWAEAQPDRMDHPCVRLNKDANDYRWEDYSCNDRLSFVCQSVPPTTTTTTTTTTTPTPTTTTTTEPTTTTTLTTTTSTRPSTPTRPPPPTPSPVTPSRATPSPATPSRATPSPVTPSRATPTRAQPSTPSAGPPSPSFSPDPNMRTTAVPGDGDSANLSDLINSKGVIIAIVIVAVFVLAGFIRLTCYCCQRRTVRDDEEKFP